MKAINKVNLVKALITANNSKFVSVTFKKVDGSLRTIVHNTHVKKGIKGDGATWSGFKAVKTRQANHPNLVSVFDTILASKGVPAEKCWRTVNCETVISVRCMGESINFD